MPKRPAVYYNEHDPVSAEWLRRLSAANLIAPGEVDERDIRDVAPSELIRFTQCHFFAGIGIWSYALRRAGWPDDRPIWTGSCPCQPFSAAGAGEGFADERHLWPHWQWLIQHNRPRVVVGEQVAGKDGLGWFDLVSDDLGGIDYASGAVDVCAAGFGMDWRGSAESQRLERALRLCPDPMVARHLASFAEWADQALAVGGFHVRGRLYFVGLADAEDAVGRSGIGGAQAGARPDGERGLGPAGGGADSGLADADRPVAELAPGQGAGPADAEGRGPRGEHPGRRDADGLVDGLGAGLEGRAGDVGVGDQPGRLGAVEDRPAPAAGLPDRLDDADRGGQPELAPPRLLGRRPGEGGDEPATGEADGLVRDDADGRRDAGRVADPDGGNAAAEREQRGGQHGLEPSDLRAGGLADGAGRGRGEQRDAVGPGQGGHPDGGVDAPRGLADASGLGRAEGRDGDHRGDDRPVAAADGQDAAADAADGERGAVDWLFCRDEQWRPAEAGTFPLADATPGRVGSLRAYGNGLDAETATEFCKAVRQIVDELEMSGT